MQSKQYHSNYRFPTQTPPETEKRRFPVWPVVGIFLILGFQFVAQAREFLMPVTLAILLFFVFVPFRRFMERMGVGATATAGIVTLGLILATVGLGYVASGPISEISQNSESIANRLEDRLKSIRANFRGIEKAAQKIDELSSGKAAAPAAAGPTAIATPGLPAPDGDMRQSMATESPSGGATTTVATTEGAAATATMTTEAPHPGTGVPVKTQQKIEVKVDTAPQNSAMQQILAAGPNIGGQVVFTLTLLFFLISSGDLLYLKIVQSFDTMKDKRAAYMALREIEDSLGSYLGAISIINIGLGVAIGVAMWAFGMPNPILWGVSGFVLNYIPYIGAIGGMIVSVIVALMVYDDLFMPIMVGLTYIGLTSLEGQFITPYFVSRKLQLNEVVVFLTVALWAWLWSVLGMVVAVPLLVVLRVLADHIPGLEKFGNFLAGEDPPALTEEEEAEKTAEAPRPA